MLLYTEKLTKWELNAQNENRLESGERTKLLLITPIDTTKKSSDFKKPL